MFKNKQQIVRTVYNFEESNVNNNATSLTTSEGGADLGTDGA